MSSQSQKNHPLFVDEILVDTPREVGGVPLKMAANRYYTTSAAISSDNDVTLLFAHANGTREFHTLRVRFIPPDCSLITLPRRQGTLGTRHRESLPLADSRRH